MSGSQHQQSGHSPQQHQPGSTPASTSTPADQQQLKQEVEGLKAQVEALETRIEKLEDEAKT